MNNEEIQVCLQPTQKKYAKLEILNQSDNIVDELSGLCIDGGYSIDSKSAIRRTCDIKFMLTSKLVISQSSPIWINKRFRLYTGILNLITQEVVWFLQGIYLISDPSTDIAISENTISIKGIDKMAMFTNDVSGQLTHNTLIEVDTPISDAIKSTVTILGGETKLLIDISPYSVPYKIEKDAGNTTYDLLKEISDLYMGWKIYYDIYGTFIFIKTKNHINDPVIFDFSIYNVIQSINQNIKYSNIKNYFKVIGKLHDDGTQCLSELTVTDALYPNNLFTVEKMNEFSPRRLVISEDKYYTQEQCDSRISYEYDLHNNFAEEVILTCLPLPFLDCDMVIYLNYPEWNIVGNYCITTVSAGLRFDSMMQISAFKIYN
jgi:hypothetical protein